MFRKISIFSIIIVAIFAFVTLEAAAFSFSLSLDPQSGSTDKEGRVKTAVNIYSSSSEKGRVSLFAGVEPKGTRIRFTPSSCNPPCSSIMTISVSKEAGNGRYLIPIIATGKGITQKATFNLNVTPLPLFLETPRLISPLDNSTVLNLTPLLSWSEIKGARVYIWQIGNKSGESLQPSLVLPSGILNYNTRYYWKVKACTDSSQKECSSWSQEQSFVTPKSQEAVLATIRAQIAAIREAILQIQKELMKLISSGAI